MSEQIRRFDVQKFWNDLRRTVIAVSPTVVSYLYLRDMEMFIWASEFATVYDHFSLIFVSMLSGFLFWALCFILYMVGKAFVRRYTITEEEGDAF